MVSITGFIGTVYFLLDKNWRGDVWRSQVWPTPGHVLDELLEKRISVLECIHSGDNAYSDYDPDEDEEYNAKYIAAYREMIEYLRAEPNSDGVEYSFDDFSIVVRPTTVHLPHVAEY